MQAYDIVAQPTFLEQPTPFVQLNLSANPVDAELAIGSAVMLDQQLYDLLLAALQGSPKQRRRLLNNAALRKALAYCTGLIDAADFEDLGLIGRIRNRFAHDFPRPTFESDEIRGLASQLSGYHDDLILGLDRRTIYVRAVCRISGRLSLRLAQVQGDGNMKRKD